MGRFQSLLVQALTEGRDLGGFRADLAPKDAAILLIALVDVYKRQVQDLSRTVDMAMMNGGTGLILCAYSGETFNLSLIHI